MNNTRLRGLDRPTLAGLIALMLWASFGLLSRFVNHVPPLQISAMAFAIAGVAGMIVLVLRRRLAELRQPPIAWLHGVGGIFAFNAFLFIALTLAPPTQAITIEYSWPLFTVLLSAIILKIRLRQTHIIGLALGFCSCTMLALHSDQIGFHWRYLPGYLCALACAVTWALYSALSSKLERVPSGALAGFFLVIAVMNAAMGLCFYSFVWPDLQSWITIAALGLGPMGMAYFLWDYGVKHGNPMLLGVLSYLAPVMSYLMLASAHYATLGIVPLVAAILVVIGSAIAARA